MGEMRVLNMLKNMKIRIAVAAVLLILAIILVVSGIIALVRPVMGLLGFDLNDYDGEQVELYLESDSREAKKVVDVLSMLLYSPTPTIYEFDGAREAADLYTDSVLSYMMSRNYSKYVCNIELLSRASDSYANYNFRTVVPASDFRSEIYRAFGGDYAVHEKSGEAFAYHEKIDSFSLVGTPYEKRAEIVVSSFGVSEHTYKMTFSIASENGVSEEYIALCIPREDGTVYIKSIKKLAS